MGYSFSQGLIEGRQNSPVVPSAGLRPELAAAPTSCVIKEGCFHFPDGSLVFFLHLCHPMGVVLNATSRQGRAALVPHM